MFLLREYLPGVLVDQELAIGIILRGTFTRFLNEVNGLTPELLPVLSVSSGLGTTVIVPRQCIQDVNVSSDLAVFKFVSKELQLFKKLRVTLGMR